MLATPVSNVHTFSKTLPYHDMGDACSYGIILNNAKAPLDNVNVRWALALALDLQNVGINSMSGQFRASALPVFREPGYALPEAKVVLTLKDSPKGKKLETLTSPRGEFTFRVPPVSATYILKVSSKGFRPDEKEAVVTGEDRVDVTFVLVPESK